MNTCRALAFDVLREFSRAENPELKDILDDALRESELSSGDRRLAAELVYGTVRWRRRLDRIIKECVSHRFSVKPAARELLRMGIHQLMIMDRVPPHAAIYETVELAKRHRAAPGFVNAVLRRIQRDGDPVRYPSPRKNPIAHLALYYSLPNWIVGRWVERNGPEAAAEMCNAANAPPGMTLRVNTMRTERDAVATRLEQAGATAVTTTYSPDALRVGRMPPLTEADVFREGLCVVQDESSQLVTHLLDPQPGETVLDLCAAPGGKTTHIAERMRDTGVIVACDIAAGGLARVRENAERLGLSCIDTRLHNGRHQLTEYRGIADRVLVDAPCSALGILRRHADARWGKEESAIAGLANEQLRLLDAAAGHVKPDGVLVYGVCTDTPEETVGTLTAFLDKHPSFRVEPASDFIPALSGDAQTSDGALSVTPHRHNMDGFYAARLRRHQ
ncbi:16S rRNA (cytosine(967)-C(5))-methyltransferase [Candidatus Poribacteria bacterium]|nr:16S rRNA (cytosine(967)-C(5))-methyltransferase [Candidatus Poribacteria bacterium]